MQGAEQLPRDRQPLVEIILRQRADLAQRDFALARNESALELCDLNIERLSREAAAAVAARDAAVKMIEQVRREAAEQMEALRQKHKAEIDALLRRFYGPKSERFNAEHLLLFGKLVDTMPIDQPAVEQESGQKLKTRRPQHKHGRQNLPRHLERIPIELDLPQEQKRCPCCGKLRPRIGTEITEQLEYIPALLRVLQFIQHKYGCPDCDANGLSPQIELAPKPPQPIEKGLAGPGLIAYVITSKLADHLPLYRLERIFARQNVHVAGSTMCGWIMAAAELLAPLALLMKQRIKQSKAMHSDETRLPVQAKDQCRKGRIWDYIGDCNNPYIVFDYTIDRCNDGPIAWLEGWTGFLQADAYTGYDELYRGGVREVACWAHARRKFFDAKGTDSRRAAELLAMVAELYAVESEAAKQIALLKVTGDQADAVRLEFRQSRSVATLAKIKAWLDHETQLVLPRSEMAKAINYMLNQWTALCIYAEHGFLNIDNNAAERALKLIAIGRRNWLFAGNDKFAAHYATLYSLIASAQRHGLDPLAYLTGVLAQIPTAKMSELEQFLPDVWKARLEAEKAAATASGPAP